jgi:hypothetical protein
MPTTSFLQMAGAIPFSLFLSGGIKRTPRTVRDKKRRVNRRTGIKRRRVDRRTDKKRVDRKTGRKKTDRKMRKKTDRKRRKKTDRKTKKKNKNKKVCLCSKKHFYSGDELSPQGMGYCAVCTPLNVVIKGKDGNLWENKKLDNSVKKWSLVRKDMRGGFIRDGI